MPKMKKRRHFGPSPSMPPRKNPSWSTHRAITSLISRKGDCWDNAPTESGFNSFKNERVHGVRYASHDDRRDTAFESIEVFYNRTRKHSTLGYQSPAQYLDQWIKGLQAQRLVT